MSSKFSNTDDDRKQRKRKWKPSFEYKVDYNDHFETPLVAYQDILPVLDGLKKGWKRKDHTVYDPYYCDGRTAILLNQLGFEKVVHAKQDFYKDVRCGTVPNHDTLITNPPYSDQHKERCLEICLRQLREENKPFLLLMPNYVASRSYYRRILGESAEDVAYVIPSTPYVYDHPEGTGHAVSPFASLWFCGVGKTNITKIKDYWNQCSWEFERQRPRFVSSLSELEGLDAIPTQKRPNPRQRKKRKMNRDGEKETHKNDKPPTTTGTKASNQSKTNSEKLDKAKVKKPKKSSRYRDEKGKRTKKRF